MTKKITFLLLGLIVSFLSIKAQPGNTLHFDGVDDYVSLGNWETPTNLTVEAWVYPEDLTGLRTVSSQFDGWSSTTAYVFRIDNGIPTFRLSEGGAGNTIELSSGETINAGEWSHLAATFDGSTAKIYINGILKNEITNPLNIYQINTIEQRIGNSVFHGEHFAGKIEELRIWNVARSNCEIQQALDTELVGNETGLIAYYSFNQGTAGADNSGLTTLNDETTIYDGTLNNFALSGTASNWLSSDVNVPDIANFQESFAPVPDVTSLSDVTAECFSSPTAPTATDVCDGAITGTTTTSFPITVQGTTTVTWTYEDSYGNTATQNQDVVIEDITDPTITCVGDQTLDLPVGQTSYTVSGAEFDPTSSGDNCGVASVTNDYNSSGTLDGEVLASGSYTIIWAVTDDNARMNTCQTVITINEASGTTPIIAGCDITDDETTTTFIGTLDNNGGSTVTECGFYWGTTDVVADLVSSGTQEIADAPVQSGDFTVTLNTVDLPATYYFVPYATNGSGTAYGDGACATLTPEFSCSYSNLSSSSVTLEGAVVDDIGVTFVSYGFYLTDNMTTQPSENAATGDASGFTANISALSAETTYYYMPYGVDADGEIWSGAGDPCQFTTPAAADLPVLSGCDITDDETTTTFIGTLDNNGGSSVTECGFYWGTTEVVADLVSSGTQEIADAPVQSGDFTVTLNTVDLPATYYFVPYATNGSGTAYGDGACATLTPEFSCSYSNLSSASVTLEGAVVDDIGVTFVSYGFYLTDNMTTQPSENAATGDASGFTANISALSAETTYYYMPYGVDADGEIWSGAGDPCQFTTPAAADLPVLSGCDINDDETTTTFIGTLANNGGSTVTECGFYWGTTEVVADLISSGTQEIADAPVQSGDFTVTLNTVDLPATYYFVPYATNGSGTAYGDGACATLTPEFSCSYSNLSSASVTLEGAVVDDIGVTFVSYGFYLTDNMTTQPSENAATGDASGFTANISALSAETTYYYMPYGVDADGEIWSGAGDPCQFTTPAAADLPVLSGCDINDDETTTTFIGTLANNGGSTVTECGFYWGTTEVVADLVSSGTQVIADAPVQSGDFTATLNTDDLPATYYFVAYATNGSGTAYGDGACATLTPEFSCSYSNLSSASVTLEGAVVDDIGVTFVSYGFYLTDNMTTQPSENAATGDASGFTANISALSAETTYYFMSYGVDADGEIWSGAGDPCQFTTPAAADLPVLSGCDITDDETTTTFIGTLANNGGSTVTECGFYWGTTEVVADLVSSGTQVIADAPVQSGDFTATLNTDDLPATYYFVAYATNGSGTAYGDGACATLTPEFSCSYSNLSSASVTLEGAVVDDIGVTFVSYGFYLTDDMTAQPSENAAAGDATGFTADIAALTAETTYYFMPYGVDADGEIWTGANEPCEFTTSAAELSNLFIPNAFTPNGDGINDKFVITGIEAFPDNTILIVNRWGNKVYETEGYNNDWDGKNQFGVSLNKDGFLPEGVYFYILHPSEGSDVIKGSIYLKRE